MADKSALRRRLRATRRQMDARQQLLASHSLFRRALLRLRALRHARHIGFYLARDGEIDLSPLLGHCQMHRRRCYLPVLDGEHCDELSFAPYLPGQPLTLNRYSIPEPATPLSSRVSACRLDLIFMPAVGADLAGRRLGMGGGYYDRSLARCPDSTGSRPLLVTTIHERQLVDELPDEPWDVRCDILLTPARLVDLRDHMETQR